MRRRLGFFILTVALGCLLVLDPSRLHAQVSRYRHCLRDEGSAYSIQQGAPPVRGWYASPSVPTRPIAPAQRVPSGWTVPPFTSAAQPRFTRAAQPRFAPVVFAPKQPQVDWVLPTPIDTSTQRIQPAGAEQFQPLQPEQCFGNPHGDCFRHAHHSHVRVRRSPGVLTEFVDLVAAIVTLPDRDHPDTDTSHYESGTRHYEVDVACYEDDCAHHSGACETDCAHRCDCETASFWEHRTGMFADYLYLSAGGVDLPYATPVDGFGALSVPIGSVAIADPDHESGFRVGGMFAIDADSSIVATFWNFESGTKDSFALPGGTGFVRSDLTHPNTSSVAADSLAASADYGIEFQNVDLAYKSILYAGDAHSLNYFLGVRYTRLEQQLAATYSILGTTSVLTNIDFDGVGPQLGLESERLLGHGFLLFARGTANFLVGEFRADYQQFNSLALTQAVAGFEDDRLVTQLELELGLGWENSSGRLAVRAGYYRAGWFNTVTTPAFVNAVQSGSFDDVDDTLTFDGLTLRTEIRF